MNLDNIVNDIEWSEEGLFGRFTIDQHIMGSNVEAVLCDVPQKKGGRLHRATVAHIKTFLAMNDLTKQKVADLLYDHFQNTISHTSYGFVEPATGETEEQAIIRFFNIHSPTDAMEQISSVEAYIYHNWPGFVLELGIPWDDEHGCRIKVNQRSVEFDS